MSEHPDRKALLSHLDVDGLGAALQDGGRVSRILPGFEQRSGQVGMLRAVGEAFNLEKVLVVEAGTGVGKSLAYGLPAAAWAQASGERVVISSATINLQQQLVHRDLPLVNAALGTELRVVLVKGRGNYLCRRRLSDLLQRRILLDLGELGEILQNLSEWAESTADGSRSDLPFPCPEGIWEQLCSDQDACLGRKCPMRESCFLVSARREAERAELLVVNHHLLFADLALRRARDDWSRRAVLPPFNRVVLDEAHNLEASASSFFGIRLTRTGVLRALARLQPPRKGGGGLLGELARELKALGGALAAGRADRLIQETEGVVIPRLTEAREAYQRAFGHLAGFVLEAREARVRLTPEVYRNPAWTAVREGFRQAAEIATALASELEHLIDRLVDLNPDEGKLAEVRACIGRTRELAQSTVQLISELPDGSVRWAEADRQRKIRLSLQSAPLDVSSLMNQTLYDQMATVVLTSATLSIGGSFDFLCSRIGVDRQPEERVATLLVESPFDFTEQVRLALPSDLPPPDQPIFEQVLPETVFQAVAASGGRALVLFTSWGLMTRVYQMVKGRLEELGLEVYCQGEMPRDRLLNRFRENESSILFGTDSFWQGVDVVGPALRNVVITRLPFDVPDEPLIQARMEAVELEGKNPFVEFMLPRAVLKLKQGFGRLVRSCSDWGAVVVLDQRLLSRSYGRSFLESLPPATLLAGPLEEVCDQISKFFAERGEPSPVRITKPEIF